MISHLHQLRGGVLPFEVPEHRLAVLESPDCRFAALHAADEELSIFDRCCQVTASLKDARERDRLEKRVVDEDFLARDALMGLAPAIRSKLMQDHASTIAKAKASNRPLDPGSARWVTTVPGT